MIPNISIWDSTSCYSFANYANTPTSLSPSEKNVCTLRTPISTKLNEKKIKSL